MIEVLFVCVIFCAGPDPKPTAADSFCTVYEKAARNRLKLSRRSVDAMTDRELDDVVGLKRAYARLCPPKGGK
jgi:hypothetical protein